MRGRLVATGVQAYLTHQGGAWTSPRGERAEFANRTDAHLCISLQVDAADNPDAAGVSTYFFGLEPHGAWSSAGERFASLVQREIVARTDLVDLRSHAKNWDLLRRTKMPAVRIDVGYLTNAGDARPARRPGLPRRGGRGRRGRGAADVPQPRDRHPDRAAAPRRAARRRC